MATYFVRNNSTNIDLPEIKSIVCANGWDQLKRSDVYYTEMIKFRKKSIQMYTWLDICLTLPDLN